MRRRHPGHVGAIHLPFVCVHVYKVATGRCVCVCVGGGWRVQPGACPRRTLRNNSDPDAHARTAHGSGNAHTPLHAHARP
jgi:hypothetical protein